MDAGGDDAAIYFSDALECLRQIPGDHLGDPRKGVFLVARIDSLGRIPDEKILFPYQARMAFDQGDADFLGRSGVNGRFKHHDRPRLQIPANGLACPDQRTEVGVVRIIDWRRHSDHDEIGLL